MKNIESCCVNQNESIKVAMQAIDTNGSCIALVLDDSSKLVGITTDSDIRRAIIEGKPISSPVKDVINKNPVTSPSKDVAVLNKILASHPKISPIRIPVIDEDGKIIDLAMMQDPILKDWTFFSETSVEPTHDKKVLIIGGLGYIGSVLTRQLLDKGYSVKILDSGVYGAESIKDVEGNDKLTLRTGDTRHVEVLSDALKDVDIVVQLAELVGDPACAIDSKKTLQINYLATNLLANACKFFQINRFVYVSSCSVYGESEGNERLTEESPFRPVSLYAQMKIESEKAIMYLKDENFSPCVLRLGTVFGKSPRMRFDLVVNTLTAHAAKNGAITIFGGDQWRPNVHVADVARAINHVIEAPISKVRGEVFNVGSNENNMQIVDIGKKVYDVFENKIKMNINDDAVDKRNYMVSFDKIKRVLGFHVKYNVEDGVKEIKESFEKGEYKDWTDKKFSNYKSLVDEKK